MPNQIVHATEENVGDGLTKEELKIRKKQAAKEHGTLLQLIHSKSCHAQELRSFEGVLKTSFEDMLKFAEEETESFRDDDFIQCARQMLEIQEKHQDASVEYLKASNKMHNSLKDIEAEFTKLDLLRKDLVETNVRVVNAQKALAKAKASLEKASPDAKPKAEAKVQNAQVEVDVSTKAKARLERDLAEDEKLTQAKKLAVVSESWASFTKAAVDNLEDTKKLAAQKMEAATLFAGSQ